jgi:cysteine-rich repeat protein
VTPATTVCNPGSGDICDPDESCTGVAGEACPEDRVAPATTVCNPGSGDICDPDESCTGVAGEACTPTDTIAPATTICRTGSGDICDPDESCTGVANEACPDDVVQPVTTICRQGTNEVCDPDESCTGEPGATCPDDVVLPCEECLTRTGGYWGTHPWATIEFLPVTSCGLEVNNVLAYINGDKVDTLAYGSAIEDICFGGNDSKGAGYSPQQTQLIRQCTVAAINMAATSYYEGSCDGYVIPENECIPVDVPCTDGQCSDGSGTCTVDADCAYSYCSQGGADSCDTNEDCPDNPFTLWIIPDVMACEFSPDENCSANNDACKDSSNNRWLNCRGDLGDNPACGFCGDGYVRGTEECDDGNTDNFDECSNDCVLNSP